MSVLNDSSAFRKATLGLQATKSLPAVTNGVQALFTVTGHVVLNSIVGVVTVAMDATATSINLDFDPTIGSSVDLCAATVVTSDEAGTLYGIETWVTGLLVANATSAPGTAYTPLAPTSGSIVLAPGQITLVGTAANVGDTTWYAEWVPLTDGATLVAA
jgi:hypothetical protein